MQSIMQFLRLTKQGTRLVLLAAMMLALLLYPAAAKAAPLGAAVSIDLCATTGTISLPSSPANLNVTIWGYALGDCTGAPAAQLPGPVIDVNEGDVVTVTLHNNLGEASSLLFDGMSLPPDTVGAAALTGAATYTFTATHPGTYLYEAGLTPNGQHQVAMGMYGALIVRAATAGQAYNDLDAHSAYADEAVLVLSEIDPALNGSANPAAFDMRNYNPRYGLINGLAYPNTLPIASAAGNRVLLRYANAGIQYHSMALLGTHQTVIALDGRPLAYTHRMVAETMGPGQTLDAIVTIPANAPDGSRFAIYDGNLMLHNSNQAGVGGMLTFLTASAVAGSDVLGPATLNVAYTAGTLTATIDDTGTGGSTILAAEYYLDSTSGTPVGMSAADSAFDSVSEGVTAAVAVPSGSHTLYVRGQDAAGNWGAFGAVLVNGGDASGPSTSGLSLSPNPTNGSANAALHATANDSASGGSNIAAAEYSIDGGAAVPMTVNLPAVIASIDATIPAADIAALSEGSHVVAVRSQDSAGNWGVAATINLVVDVSGPATSGVSAAPNPNNGNLPINQASLAVRVSALAADALSGGVNSNIAAAEGFIDTVGANGSGFQFVPSDGQFNNPSEAVLSDIPLTTVALLSDGNHTIYVHGRDAAGNWGATSSTTLVVDKTRPTLSGVSASPNPTNGALSVTLSATANDATTGVTAAEWFVGADPGVGLATPMTVSGTGPWSLSAAINVATWTEGNYTLSVRAKDGAQNWSLVGATVLTVTHPLYFSTLGNTNPPGVGGAADNADIYFWSGSAFSRVIDANGVGSLGLPSGANVDGFDRVDATHFYLSFNANTNVPGLGTVQDEDVVYYNAGVWSVFFDGTARGLTANNQDLDAISVSGGVLYFSTVGNTNPPGVTGAADDADIYSWNGASFARVWDATANGLPGGANVDGLVFIDATHFYLSFAGTTTAVPGLGNVADTSVVYNNAGVWSNYFVGPSHGLTAGGNLDIDAFDLP